MLPMSMLLQSRGAGTSRPRETQARRMIGRDTEAPDTPGDPRGPQVGLTRKRGPYGVDLHDVRDDCHV